MKREKLIGVSRNSIAFCTLRKSVRVTCTAGPAASTRALVLAIDVSTEPAASRSLPALPEHAARAITRAQQAAESSFMSEIRILNALIMSTEGLNRRVHADGL